MQVKVTYYFKFNTGNVLEIISYEQYSMIPTTLELVHAFLDSELTKCYKNKDIFSVTDSRSDEVVYIPLNNALYWTVFVEEFKYE